MAIFWHSIGNFPEGQLPIHVLLMAVRFRPKLTQICHKHYKALSHLDLGPILPSQALLDTWDLGVSCKPWSHLLNDSHTNTCQRPPHIVKRDISHKTRDIHNLHTNLGHSTDVYFCTKVGQIDPKWNKSETFSDQILVHFGASRQNVLKCDLK